eukprot:RCo055710
MTSAVYTRDPYSAQGISYVDVISRQDFSSLRPFSGPSKKDDRGDSVATAMPHRSSTGVCGKAVLVPPPMPFIPLPGIVLPVVVSHTTPVARLPRQPLGSEQSLEMCVTTPAGVETMPCLHTTKWKRLRWRKGLHHYVCRECGQRWKGSEFILGFVPRTV